MDATSRDGHRQFDFLHGHWAVLNEKLENPLDHDSTTWFRFDSIVTVTPILGGFGNYDRYSAPEFPGRPGFEAFALRLYDPGRDVWRSFSFDDGRNYAPNWVMHWRRASDAQPVIRP